MVESGIRFVLFVEQVVDFLLGSSPSYRLCPSFDLLDWRHE